MIALGCSVLVAETQTFSWFDCEITVNSQPNSLKSACALIQNNGAGKVKILFTLTMYTDHLLSHRPSRTTIPWERFLLLTVNTSWITHSRRPMIGQRRRRKSYVTMKVPLHFMLSRPSNSKQAFDVSLVKEEKDEEDYYLCALKYKCSY